MPGRGRGAWGRGRGAGVIVSSTSGSACRASFPVSGALTYPRRRNLPALFFLAVCLRASCQPSCRAVFLRGLPTTLKGRPPRRGPPPRTHTPPPTSRRRAPGGSGPPRRDLRDLRRQRLQGSGRCRGGHKVRQRRAGVRRKGSTGTAPRRKGQEVPGPPATEEGRPSPSKSPSTGMATASETRGPQDHRCWGDRVGHDSILRKPPVWGRPSRKGEKEGTWAEGPKIQDRWEETGRHRTEGADDRSL